MPDRDEAWLAAARQRLAHRGTLDRPWEEIVAAAPPQPPRQQDAGLRCPYCRDHAPLEPYKRYEVGGGEPLRICNRCHRFWAQRDALAYGVKDARDSHVAFRAIPASHRCRACGGPLDSEETCTRCHEPLPPLDCPACGQPMSRERRKSVVVDVCNPCDGVWFDPGEIMAAYGLAPADSLASAYIDKHYPRNPEPEEPEQDPGSRLADALPSVVVILLRLLLRA